MYKGSMHSLVARYKAKLTSNVWLFEPERRRESVRLGPCIVYTYVVCCKLRKKVQSNRCFSPRKLVGENRGEFHICTHAYSCFKKSAQYDSSKTDTAMQQTGTSICWEPSRPALSNTSEDCKVNLNK